MAQYYTYPVVAVSGSFVVTGGATAANQVLEIADLDQIKANQTNGTQTTSVSNFPATQPVSGTVTVVQPTGSNLHVVVDSSALPTGAATAANQSTIISQLTSKLSGSLVPLAYDEIDLTYVPSGNGVGQVATALYKLASSTIATLTMTYDSSNRLSSVVKS